MLKSPNMAGKIGEHISGKIIPLGQTQADVEGRELGRRGSPDPSDRKKVVLEEQVDQHLPAPGTISQTERVVPWVEEEGVHLMTTRLMKACQHGVGSHLPKREGILREERQE
jgi:hypothetical protein